MITNEELPVVVGQILVLIKDGQMDDFLKPLTQQVYLRRDAIHGTSSFTTRLDVDGNGIVNFRGKMVNGTIWHDPGPSGPTGLAKKTKLRNPATNSVLRPAFENSLIDLPNIWNGKAVDGESTKYYRFFEYKGKYFDRAKVEGSAIFLPKHMDDPYPGELVRIDKIARKTVDVTFLSRPRFMNRRQWSVVQAIDSGQVVKLPIDILDVVLNW